MTHELPELELHRRLVRDCQDSLATALARLEAYRCRERMLTRENQALRAALLHAGIRIDQVIKPQREAVEDVGGPHVRAASAEPSAATMPAPDTASPDALYITPMAGTYPYTTTCLERRYSTRAECRTACCSMSQQEDTNCIVTHAPFFAQVPGA